MSPSARTLVALPPEALRKLRVRAYHLHRAPTSPPPSHDGLAPGDSRPTFATLRTSPASLIVLEPDLLFNITDINHAEYCARQYALGRLVPSPPSPASVRGTILHGAFKELLKGQAEDPQTLLRQALRAHVAELAVQQLAGDAIMADAEPHLAALIAWHTRQRQQLWSSVPHIRVETFVLAPDVGLKGRLDALWEDDYTNQLLELKTSTVRGDVPRREHRWQVYGYQTLLAARQQRTRDKRPAATLLYSGTPGQAEAYTLPFTLRDLQRVMELRNLLAITHATSVVPAPPGERKCGRCAVRAQCLRTSALLGWEAPPSDEQPEAVDAADMEWFRRYYRLLSLEGQASERQSRALWLLTPEERCAAGIAIAGLEPVGEPEPTERGEWHYIFRCVNTSELRENDAVLLSDGDPIHGAAVTGTVLSVSHREIAVWTPERIARPALIDRYGSDIVHDRTLHNLWRWLGMDARLRGLMRGQVPPTFDDAAPEPAIPHFNPEQRHAVWRALAAQDYLLIQGPPGTGKTRVVAEIVRRLVQRGERVLVAAFTNQAVDNVLARLIADGFEDFVRLGHELSVAPALRTFRLGERVARAGGSAAGGAPTGDVDDPASVRRVLRAAPVVATTTATWSSEQFDGSGEALAFDVAVVDEASQLTVPALVGALRFARRFVLVGDDRQLPPLVASREAAAGGLKEPLFTTLLARWGAAASVALTRQYRMHPIICAFPSRESYAGALATEGAARTAHLVLDSGRSTRWDDVLDPLHPVVFVDVPNPDPERRPQSRASARQADVVRALVEALRGRGVSAERIGVIAPYRAQVAAIRQRLASAGEADVLVDTVDRFQGGEREVIVLSFGADRLLSGEAADGAFLADPYRLNVALTRAQRKLVLVGNRAALREVPLFARLMRHCATLYGGSGGIIVADKDRLTRPD
jgi:DNA replication ATP-dependent helicase Dna2